MKVALQQDSDRHNAVVTGKADGSMHVSAIGNLPVAIQTSVPIEINKISHTPVDLITMVNVKGYTYMSSIYDYLGRTKYLYYHIWLNNAYKRIAYAHIYYTNETDAIVANYKLRIDSDVPISLIEANNWEYMQPA